MTSSLSNNSFAIQACLPYFNDDDQAEGNNIPNHLKKKNNNDRIASKPEMKQTEELLSSEMSQLSVQERSNALDDLHCVGEELRETPEMIQRSLAEFEDAVRKERNPVYEMAVNQNRAHVEDPKFRLKFLRAKLYDTRKSVRKMMSFLECKAKYFGNDKVAREIDLSDLSKEDMELMLSGLFHVQDERDRRGRVVLHFFGKLLRRCKADNLIRISYYIIFNTLSFLPDVQRKGIVAVYNDATLPGETFSMPGFSFIKEIQGFFDSGPLRFSGIHYCLHARGHNLALNNAIASLFLNGMAQCDRVRTRIHYGSIMELQYQLQSYGIPLSTIPFGVRGNIRNDILNVWFERHLKETNQSIRLHELSQDMEIESDLMGYHVPQEQKDDDARYALLMDPWQEGGDTVHTSGMSDSIKPTEMDVLFGKGYRLQLHPGNVRFREFLEQHRDEYESTPRQNRRAMAVELAQSLRNNGARFLQKAESGEWMESDNSQAEKKVSQFFRELRKKKAKEAGGR
ncbi:unnamed protein product [Cylindrotheca closterium]|uniref:DUF6824 domain-containing protein n=1 Tax=Cylindrotheca closterium TaxID=2856 RepID=A0AAD2JPF7_9STRA|nr:unnamed protein product [Cylindrotheca closterium]